MLSGFAAWYAVFLVPAFLLGGPVAILSRKQVRWVPADLSILVLPFASWFVGFSLNFVNKGMINLGLEPILSAVSVPVYVVTRWVVTQEDLPKWLPHLTVMGLTAAAFLMGAFLPQMGANC